MNNEIYVIYDTHNIAYIALDNSGTYGSGYYYYYCTENLVQAKFFYTIEDAIKASKLAIGCPGISDCLRLQIHKLNLRTKPDAIVSKTEIVRFKE